MPKRAKPTPKFKYHIEQITSRKHTYEVEVKGTRSPVNHSIIIENAGKGYVINPRVRANDQSDWLDVETMLRDTLKGFRTDEEKAIALCYLFEGTRFQRSNVDRHSVHPVVLLGSYGYGICGHTAAALDALAHAAGFRSRHWEINHHTVMEIYFDGAWHMLDGNISVFYLKRDNRTIASMADLENDPDLVGRTQPLGGKPHSEVRNWYTTKKYHYHYPTQNRHAVAERSLGYTLRPSERLERYWHKTYKYHDQVHNPAAPRTYANGKFILELDLTRTNVLDWLRKQYTYAKNLKWTRGRSPALRVDRLQIPVYDQASGLVFDVRSPYVIVGGKLCLRMHKSGSSERDEISVRVIPYGTGREATTLYQAMETGDFDVELDLARGIQPWGNEGNYFYEVVVSMQASGETKPPGVTGLDELRLESDVQVAPKALPALRLGTNVLTYTDESEKSRDVRVIHVWKERTEGKPPRAPRALSPAKGQRVGTLAPTLRWRQPEGNDDIVDYQIMVSRWPHCRLPHCANLYGTLGRNDARFDVPPGWLTPRTTFYWKVRAKDSVGDWSAWSDVAAFRT